MKKCLMITALFAVVVFADARSVSVRNVSRKEVDLEFSLQHDSSNNRSYNCRDTRSVTIQPQGTETVDIGRCCLRLITITYGTTGGTVEGGKISLWQKGQRSCPSAYRVRLVDRDWGIRAIVNGRSHSM